MTADVNVTEKVARALADRAWGHGMEFAEDVCDAMHAALRDPEVLAGIARVLMERGLLGCCVDCPTRHTRSHHEEQAREVAAAVVDWLTGGAR